MKTPRRYGDELYLEALSLLNIKCARPDVTEQTIEIRGYVVFISINRLGVIIDCLQPLVPPPVSMEREIQDVC